MSGSKQLRIRPIPNSSAKAILDKRHPLGAGQAFAFALGVEWLGLIRGVLTFGNPISNHAVTKFGLRQCDVLELRKMWLDDILPRNSESRALAVSVRLIAKQYPQLAMLITYCAGDEAAAAYKASGWIPQESHSYDREYFIGDKWLSARDANRHGVRKQATDVKRETRRKWIFPINDRGRQLIETSRTSNKPKRPDTGSGSDNTRGEDSTQANSRDGSTSHLAASSSARVMGRQSTRSTTTRATPVGSEAIRGDLETQITSGPRYGVDHVRTSIDFSPEAIIDAHG